MSTHAGRRAAYWFGKHIDKAPGTHAKADAKGRGGKVSDTRRWFSNVWWKGHNLERENSGRWADNDSESHSASWHKRKTSEHWDHKEAADAKAAKAGRSTWGAPYVSRREASTPAPTVTRRETLRGQYEQETERRANAAEKATNGYMLNEAHKQEFRRKHGGTKGSDVLHTGSASTAYRYASEELRSYWRAHPRQSFAEYAQANGDTSASTAKAAAKAKAANSDAARRAEEGARSADERRRAVAYRAKRKRPATEGDKLTARQERTTPSQSRHAMTSPGRFDQLGAILDAPHHHRPIQGTY